MLRCSGLRTVRATLLGPSRLADYTCAADEKAIALPGDRASGLASVSRADLAVGPNRWTSRMVAEVADDLSREGVIQTAVS